jgi:hypothetical protein
MKEFTQEMLEKLQAANDAVKGTREYNTYYMQQEYKRNGRWHFCYYTIPHMAGKIKTFKGSTYIITENAYVVERYAVNDAVKELLGI